MAASGNVYSFVLTETSDGDPDLKLFVELRDDTMMSALAGAPEFVPAQQIDDFRQQAEIAQAQARSARQAAQSSIDSQISAFRSDYPTRMKFTYRFEREKKPFAVTAIFHDDRCTYIQANPEETPALYEVKEGKPNLINFQFHNGTYVVDKILDSGYLAIGKSGRHFPDRSQDVTDPNASIPMSSAPEIQNRAPKAPGIIPKNAQTWIIVAIASIMILVIAFSSSGAPKVKTQAVATSGQSAAPPNQHQIDQYKAMVDEEARKLAAERQRLEQAKTDAVTAAANAQSAIPGQSNPYQNAYESGPPQPVAAPTLSPEEAQRIAMETERKKREFNSLFRSNLALTYRKEPMSSEVAGAGAATAELPQNTTSSAVAPEVRQTAPNTTTEAVALPRGVGTDHKTNPKVPADDAGLREPDGKNYRLFEGTVLETVLTNRLNGSFVGPDGNDKCVLP